jgi:hypothetical protein
MSPDELQCKFAAALRRELGMTDAQPGTSVVNVAAPAVNVAPRIVAEMPALPQPLEVADVDRWIGAWRYRMNVKRNNSGSIESVDLQPTRFMTAQEIHDER